MSTTLLPPFLYNLTDPKFVGENNLNKTKPKKRYVREKTTISPKLCEIVNETGKVRSYYKTIAGTGYRYGESVRETGKKIQDPLYCGKVKQYANKSENYIRRITPIVEQTTPVVTTPVGNTPEVTTPGETTPGETTPGETTPGETTPGETTHVGPRMGGAKKRSIKKKSTTTKKKSTSTKKKSTSTKKKSTTTTKKSIITKKKSSTTKKKSTTTKKRVTKKKSTTRK